MQAVAKRLEKMLETALNQLKLEQKMRKEGDNKLIDLELSLVNAEHALKSVEERHREEVANLEGRIKQLEQKLLDSRDGAEDKSLPVGKLQASAEHLEDQLKGLLDDVGSDKALGTKAHRPKREESRQGEQPARKRRKMNSKVLEELNDGYDEVLVVDEANEPEEEMGAGQDGVQDQDHDQDQDQDQEEEQYEEIDPKDISRCSVCSDEFPSARELTQHQKETDHGYSLSCKVCDKKFKTKYTLRSHEKVVHSDKMPFKCSKCDHRFKDEGSMRRHQANDDLHRRLEREKLSAVLMCNICGKTFPRNRRWCLDQHYMTHLAAKQLPCPVCGKMFSRKKTLAKHVVTCGGSLKQEA